jgi:hypothetical protein
VQWLIVIIATQKVKEDWVYKASLDKKKKKKKAYKIPTQFTGACLST